MIKSYKQVLLGVLSLLALPAMAQDCGGAVRAKKPLLGAFHFRVVSASPLVSITRA